MMKPILGALGFLFITSCSSLDYLSQAGLGQLALMNRAQPLDKVLKDERVSTRERALLSEIENIKKFGEEKMLKPTSNYQSYVKLDRAAVSWIISASEALSFVPMTWTFPIVGSLTYIGYFNLESAKEEAQKIRAKGWDVSVRGASAFSTLGWFKDPVLSTMFTEGPEALGDLANTILHESVHATFYINDQSYWNESLANFVGDTLAPEYLEKHLGANHPSLLSYLESEKKGKVRIDALKALYGDLDHLYRDPKVLAPEKLILKAQKIEKVKVDQNINREVNNASLIQMRTYGLGELEFLALFNSCKMDWSRFWIEIRKFEKFSFSKEHDEIFPIELKKIAEQGCVP